MEVHRSKEKATTKKKDSNVPPGSKDNLRETIKRIDKLINEGQNLIPSLTSADDNNKSSPGQTMGSGSGNVSKTTSEPPKVFGRDKVAEEIISKLHDDKAADHSVIGIYGASGSGKTTLAQHVCELEKNSGVLHFDLIMWIHVTKNFSVQTIYDEMLEIVSGPQKDKFSHLGTMLDTLKKQLKDKKVLLVLDDVWYSEIVHEQDDVVKLLSPLKESDKASRVLFTSRTAHTAKLLGDPNPMKIPDMDAEESFKMFMHYAFHNSGVSDQDRKDFDIVGRKISELLRKSPMAMKTVGRQLKRMTSRKEDIEYWNDIYIQKSDLLKHTTGALWWSYSQLEKHVQQCFAYCSMFPSRHELKRDQLVKMWMAQGFVDTSKTSDIGVAARECFEVLLSTTFIELRKTPDGREYYTIHDLLHELAETVSGSDFFRTEKGTVGHKIPQDVRHLFIDSYNIGELMKQIVEQKTLRTLVMSISAEITVTEFKGMLKELKKLRFVHVYLEGEFQENVIPDCIDKLKHLRYLGLLGLGFLSNGCIKLPLAFTKLYHLQELFVPSYITLHCPHNEMADLENLRHITGISFSIPHIGRMKWLQTLSGFTVKKEEGYEITQLENLNKIHGSLHIEGLENIQSKEDARRANLKNKLHISSLEFIWGTTEVTPAGHHEEAGPSSSKTQKTTEEVTPPKPEDILEALHPPALLEKLTFKKYSGSTFPSWLSSGEGGKLKKLEDLIFFDCHASSSQLKFSKPLPMLHGLEISTCSWNTLPDNIKQQLASLEELKIHSCENIKSLPELPPSIKKLQITGCKNIMAPPEWPPSLERLIISVFENMQSLPEWPSSLKILQIWGCTNIQALPEWPSSLKILQISDCRNMQSLPDWPSSLKILEINGCRKIQVLPELPPSLEELQINDCPDIQSPPGLPSSLKKLEIKHCPKIKTLPELLPPSLKELLCDGDLVDRHQDREAIRRVNIERYV